MNFFKTLISFSCLGSLLAMVALVFILIAFFSAAISSFSTDSAQVTVNDNSVLHLKLNGRITEMDVEDPLEGLPIPGAEDPAIGLLQLKKALVHAKSDEAIRGIYIDVSSFQGGYSVAREIRE